MAIKNTSLAISALTACLIQAGCCSFEVCIDPQSPSRLTTSQQPDVKDSVVQVPFETANLQPIQQAANSAIDMGKDGEGAWGEDDSSGFSYKVSWHRNNIGVSAHDNMISLGTRVYFSARLAHKVGGTHVQFAQCGHGEPEASFDIGINVTLTPKSDWSVASDANVVGPTEATPCHLGVINFDPAGKIYPRLRDLLNSKLGDIKNTVDARLQFKDKASAVWAKLQSPVSLGSDAYLIASLTGANLSPLSANNGSISLVGGLSGKAKIVVGGSVSSNPTPLPPLQIASKAPGINIEVPISVTYDDLSNYLNQNLAKRKYPYGNNTVEIDSIEVYGTSEKLVVQVSGSLTGVAKATLYLTGTPAYDGLKRVIYVQDLDYTVDTKNLLVKFADWLLHADFQKSLEGEAHYAVGDKVDALRAKASAALNRDLSPQASLTGAVSDLSILGFGLSPQQITAYLNASGNASVTLHE